MAPQPTAPYSGAELSIYSHVCPLPIAPSTALDSESLPAVAIMIRILDESDRPGEVVARSVRALPSADGMCEGCTTQSSESSFHYHTKNYHHISFATLTTAPNSISSPLLNPAIVVCRVRSNLVRHRHTTALPVVTEARAAHASALLALNASLRPTPATATFCVAA
eukprot:COSAG02_NODE_5742_length_4075_cov_7.196454_3_plen_166_part_00